MGYAFVEYETVEMATKAVEDSGRATVLGRKLNINFKSSANKRRENEDKDCWFCFDNPNVIRVINF